MMMGENFISYFNQVSGTKNNYYIETEEEINVERIKKATGINEIKSVPMNSLFVKGLKRFDYLLSYIKLKGITSDLIKMIDLVVVLGGDDFTEDYGWQGPLLNSIKFNLIKRNGLKVVMLGQTMGPYHSIRQPIMKYFLSKIDQIYPRDPITYEYLKLINLKNITITDDLALLPLTKQLDEVRSKEFITYCPSELIYKYSKEGKREEWINFNLFMIDEILSRYKTKKLVLLAHVLKPKHVDDRIITNDLYSLVREKYRERVILVDQEMYPFEVREYIQKSHFTISSRMHPIVSSIQCEIPAIALSYSSKYWGIIGRRYDLEDYIIDVRFLNYKEMKERFVFLIENIEQQYSNIQSKMRNKNMIAHESIKKALTEISSLK
jgi:colanic acid/amylovoran biosynthesis protein